jgi:hypothetical protein
MNGIYALNMVLEESLASLAGDIRISLRYWQGSCRRDEIFSHSRESYDILQTDKEYKDIIGFTMSR